MKKNFFKRFPLLLPFIYIAIIELFAYLIEWKWGKTLNLFHNGALPDYLGVCIAINLGLTFDYVQNAMRSPLNSKIRSMRAAAIAQLEDKKIEHSTLEKDLDNIEKSNNDKCCDYSRIIRDISYFWTILGVIALICEYWIKDWGLPNIIFLWPPIYFYVCLIQHYLSTYSQVKARLKCVRELETAESMKKKALEAIKGLDQKTQ